MKKINNTVQLTKTLEWVQLYQSLLEEHRDQISYNKSRLIYRYTITLFLYSSHTEFYGTFGWISTTFLIFFLLWYFHFQYQASFLRIDFDIPFSTYFYCFWVFCFFFYILICWFFHLMHIYFWQVRDPFDSCLLRGIFSLLSCAFYFFHCFMCYFFS